MRFGEDVNLEMVGDEDSVENLRRFFIMRICI